MSDTLVPVGLPVMRADLAFLADTAEFFDIKRQPLSEKLGTELLLPTAEGALLEWVDDQRGMHICYDLRLASSVANLAIFGFGEKLGDDYVGYDLQDDDAFVLFTKNGGGDWVSRHTVVVDFDGAVTYAKEFFHGPIAGNGMIGDGECVRDVTPMTGRNILMNMMRNAVDIPEVEMIRSRDPFNRSFGWESFFHTLSLSVDEQG